jgi:demethylmenaquinone methyltransferase / 2-methoxy-6-polyprenyl-1,4-benzoquinol methylase
MPIAPQSDPSDTLMTRPDSEKAVGAMFDRIAKRYDLLNRLLSARQDVRWRHHLIRQVPYRPDGVYLDMATGTGDVVIQAAKEHPEYQTFVGADISENMMSYGQVKSQEAKKQGLIHSEIEFRPMSAERILFEDQSVDCASISFGLRNVVRKDLAIAEFARVIRPGGVFLILEFFTPTGGIFSRAFQFYFHAILPLIGRLLSEKEAYTYLPKSVASFYSPSELRQVLAKKNLKVEFEKSFLFGACRLVKARKTEFPV